MDIVDKIIQQHTDYLGDGILKVGMENDKIAVWDISHAKQYVFKNIEDVRRMLDICKRITGD